jgi:LPS sulfotransferase NodH
VNRDLFQDVVVDPQRRAQLQERAPARFFYVIHFTPRSGSSWLTDVIAATRQLSAANEAFNPGFIPRIAQAVHATDLDDYFEMLIRVYNTKGVYGTEVTAHQINAVFGGYADFHKYFGNSPCFWLIRQDIVAQAVSLAKMVTTKVAHTVGSNLQSQQDADQLFPYDAALIKKWLIHIHAAETRSETWFSEYGLAPLRMSYEQTTALSPLQMVNVIARHARLPDVAPMALSSQHGKLGTEQNTVYADRFRKEEADFMTEIDAVRAPMLAKLDPIAALVADLS